MNFRGRADEVNKIARKVAEGRGRSAEGVALAEARGRSACLKL